MANSKYPFILLLCCFFSLYSVANGGGSRSRQNKRFNSGWNELYPAGYYPTNNHTPADPRYDFEQGVGVKKALGLSKIIFSPLIVPVVVPMIFFVGILLLLFFAVVGSATVAGSALGRRVPYRHSIAKQLSSTAQLASDVLGSEECVERISCEIFRKAKGHEAENWIERTLKSIPMKENWIGRISRSMRSSSDCQEFNCISVSRITRAIKLFQ